MDDRSVALSQRLGVLLKQRAGRLITVESCTGGGVAWHITSVAGSSDWFDRAIVTYSNEAKMEMVHVPPSTLTCHGAVSEETAEAMALGALRFPGITHSLSVTGVAGPGGGSPEKPVGMVCFAWGFQGPDGALILDRETCRFPGDREAVRLASIRFSLERQIALVDAQLV